MEGGGALESLPKFLWRMAMKLPEFNLFSDKSARIFLIFSSICPNFHGFPKFLGAVAPPPCPLSRTPMIISSVSLLWRFYPIIYIIKRRKDGYSIVY